MAEGDGDQDLKAGVIVDRTPLTHSGELRVVDAERVWSRGTNHFIAQWRNVLVTHWFGAVTEPPLERCKEASFDLAASHPEGIVVFNVIEHKIPLPTTAVRNKSSSVLAATQAHVRCTATIIRGEGFWASAGRAMVATITLFSKARHPHKVFGTIEAGAQWCADRVVPVGTSAARFVDAVERMTAAPKEGR